MTFTINQHVFRLYISMHDSIPVDFLDSEDQLRQVYPCMVFCQPAICLLVHDLAHVTTRAIIRYHIKVIEGLESIVELRDELMIDLALNFFFSDYEACKAIISTFFHTFHSIEFSGASFVTFESFD